MNIVSAVQQPSLLVKVSMTNNTAYAQYTPLLQPVAEVRKGVEILAEVYKDVKFDEKHDGDLKTNLKIFFQRFSKFISTRVNFTQNLMAPQDFSGNFTREYKFSAYFVHGKKF